MGMATNRTAREQIPGAVERFTRVVRAIPANRWNDPTPCSEWSVRDVVNHMTGEHRWVPHLLRGETLAQVGDRYDGDNLGADPVAAWEAAAQASVQAWEELDSDEVPVHLSFGLVPAGFYASQMMVDLTVHCWDLARGAGLDERLDAGAVATVLSFLEPQRDQLASSGFFAAPVVTGSADLQDRLLALSGRDPS